MRGEKVCFNQSFLYNAISQTKLTHLLGTLRAWNTFNQKCSGIVYPEDSSWREYVVDTGRLNQQGLHPVLDAFLAHPHAKSWEPDLLLRASHCMLRLWNRGRNAQLGCTGWEDLAWCCDVGNAGLHWSPAVTPSLLSASCERYSGLRGPVLGNLQFKQQVCAWSRWQL